MFLQTKYILENIEGAIKNGQSIKTSNTRRRETKQKHMCWTPLCANKHK